MNKNKTNLIFFSFSVFTFPLILSAQEKPYPWINEYREQDALINRIKPPEGYERVKTESGSYEHYLQHLLLKSGNPPVYLHSGDKKGNQSAHYAVIDIDTGGKNLQQCSDAVIRLRAEYLFYKKLYDEIKFKFTSGDACSWNRWKEGWRPLVKNNKVKWVKSGKKDYSYKNFRKYLESVFMYAGSFSLSKEMKEVKDFNEIRIGDVIIQGGFPGHAVIVVDMAYDKKTGKKLYLLAQSYIPAQDIHILKNPMDPSLSPWYDAGSAGETITTPEWLFRKTDLRRF